MKSFVVVVESMLERWRRERRRCQRRRWRKCRLR